MAIDNPLVPDGAGHHTGPMGGAQGIEHEVRGNERTAARHSHHRSGG
ncbi:hypothetical protein [Brachybacterium sp.]